MMRSEKLFLLVFLILSSISVSAQTDYYADVEISVSNDGVVSFKGETNHPELSVEQSQEFTSKKGRFWLLNISIDDVFSDYIYELHLPENADVNYLKTPSLSRIEDDDGIIIIGTGRNKKFVIVVQYSINPIPNNPPYIIGLAFIAIAAYLFYRGKKKKKKPSYNIDALTDRQKQIVRILEKSSGTVTQAQIEKETGLPKSSLSRNIDSLVRKGIVEKESKGMSNIVFLKENEEKE